MNGLNLMQNDVQISVNVTYHLPSLDITYLGGFQSFHYVLAIPDQAVAGIDAGVRSFQEEGAASAGAAGLLHRRRQFVGVLQKRRCHI